MKHHLPSIVLEDTPYYVHTSGRFYAATDGAAVDVFTQFHLEKTFDTLIVRFDCRDNPFISFNRMTETNDDLYNQEVFEVFIAAGEEDPTDYLEIEINPNNALWVGWVHNPSLGLGPEPNTLRMVSKDEISIQHKVIREASSWSGELQIPLAMITDRVDEKHFRINFYRIVAKEQPSSNQWICTEENAYFLCWSPTMSGQAPAFHRPTHFGHLQL
ncbi:MAG: carbohydrate-binding family 9-like protein [Spirosomataceae bacterium]